MSVHIDFLGEVNIYLGLGLEIVTSFLLGGLIGIEREKKMKAAGIKTNMLICIGATLYTAISLLNQRMVGGLADPNRVAAQVVSGIGFLGAGAILRGRGNIIGLTTAATIWVVAAVGVTIGSGHLFIATIFSITILVVLKLLGPIYRLLEIEKDYHLEILSHGSVKRIVRQLLESEASIVHELKEEVLVSEGDKRILRAHLTIHPKSANMLMNEIDDIHRVKRVDFYQEDGSVKSEEK